MVLAATPNRASSGQRHACGTSFIDNESMALMQCPSVLSSATLFVYYYILNIIFWLYIRFRCQMWVLWPSPIMPHQDSYEAVALLLGGC